MLVEVAPKAEEPVKVGDHVTWAHVPRGGYGYSTLIDARVMKLHPKHATVEVKKRSGELVRRRVALSALREKPTRQRGPICRYCGCTLAGASEVKLGSGVYDRPCYERDGDMCERTDAP